MIHLKARISLILAGKGKRYGVNINNKIELLLLLFTESRLH